MIFLSFMNLFRNYRRTLAVILTVALGTGVLFSFKGFIHGVLHQYREGTIHSHYGHGQVNTKNYRATVYSEPWNHWITNNDVLRRFLLSEKNVEHIFPRVNFAGFLKKGNVTVAGYGQGIVAEDEAKFFYGLNVESGETLTYQKDGILLGNGLAKALNVNPGDSLILIVNSTDGSIQQVELKLTGIFHTGSLDFDSKTFRIQLAQAQTLLKTENSELIAIGLKDGARWETFAFNLEQAFPQLEATSFAVLDQVYYQHSVDWLTAQFHIIQLIILSIVLLGIFNSISSSILERKQEIGNFRANGESFTNILQLITLEGVFLGLVGSCIGLTVTFIALKVFLENGILMPPGPGLTRPFYISFQFEWNMVYGALALSTLSASIASILAGVKVARMPIAKALRSH